MKILINAANLTGAGQRTTFLSLMPALLKTLAEDQFTILCADSDDLRGLDVPPNGTTIFSKRSVGIANDILRLRELFLGIPRMARQIRADMCLNMGDLGPIGMPCPNIIFLNQPLFVYGRKELGGTHGWPVWKHIGLKSYFAWSARQSAKIIVPIPVMAERLFHHYRLPKSKVAVVTLCNPNHVAMVCTASEAAERILSSGKQLKLLFLAAYYPHKNHSILPMVAEEVRRRGLAKKVGIFTTLNVATPRSARIRESLADYPDVITNLGHVPMPQVGSVLKASSALFLPTLAESFGNIYLEAMSWGLPILTSGTDFAHWMCRDIALYFNPFSPAAIVDQIEALPGFAANSSFAASVARHLATFPKDWGMVAAEFAAILRTAASANGSNARAF